MITYHNINQDDKRLIKRLSDGSCLVFARGRFDTWCIYHVINVAGQTTKHAIKDIEMFAILQKYALAPCRFDLYRDFVGIFGLASCVIDERVANKITEISTRYSNSAEVELVLAFLYAGMVAEENKQHAILKKYIKRLGVHQVLIEQLEAKTAANYSRGKKWPELCQECEARGFCPDHLMINNA